MDPISIIICILLGSAPMAEDNANVGFAAQWAQYVLQTTHPECTDPDWDYNVDANGSVSIYAISEACETAAGFYQTEDGTFTFAVEGA